MLEQGGAGVEARRSGGGEGVAFGDAEPLGGPGFEWRRPARQCAVLRIIPYVETAEVRTRSSADR
ncbi:MAG: hypothetical protein CME06_18330 [Gemmatimonadetes bacterium]|nr:hypothetical protein [Gemmatimonadota bacterium]